MRPPFYIQLRLRPSGAFLETHPQAAHACVENSRRFLRRESERQSRGTDPLCSPSTGLALGSQGSFSIAEPLEMSFGIRRRRRSTQREAAVEGSIGFEPA